MLRCLLLRRLRALAVPLDRASVRVRGSSRRWYRPASEPLPAEPGRLVVSALLSRPRRERGCQTPGDDRLETRAYALKRYLFRLGHAQRSARYATSIAQLVAGVAPVIGWGPVPRDETERARFVRCHRRSVQRWLDDLQAAGVVAHEPERDPDGVWWRTQIVLLAAPAPLEQELMVAKRRARGWRWREAARRRRGRVAPSLGAIRGRSEVPGARRRARVAFGRRASAHAARRHEAVEAQIAAAAAVREGVSRDLAHPFGAPPTEALSPPSRERSRGCATPLGEGSAAREAVQTEFEGERVVGKTGARERADGDRSLLGAGRLKAGSEEAVALSDADFDALVLSRLAARRRAVAWRSTLLTAQVTRRVLEVVAWPAGRVCPLGRLREAWVAHRYGPAIAVESGTAAAGAVATGRAADVGRAVALYEAFAAERPPGWPASGPGALCALASLGTAERFAADRFAGDVARLLVLARGMRSTALERDTARLQRAQARARARQAPPTGRFVFRIPPPRSETAEPRRCRVRDAVLLAGDNPAAWPNAALALAHHSALAAAPPLQLFGPDRFEELDGLGARATRYRAELARGRWQLPHDSNSDATQHPGGTTP